MRADTQPWLSDCSQEATQAGTAPAHRSVDTQPGRFIDCPAALSTAQSSTALYPGCVRIEAQRRHPDFLLCTCTVWFLIGNNDGRR